MSNFTNSIAATWNTKLNFVIFQKLFHIILPCKHLFQNSLWKRQQPKLITKEVLLLAPTPNFISYIYIYINTYIYIYQASGFYPSTFVYSHFSSKDWVSFLLFTKSVNLDLQIIGKYISDTLFDFKVCVVHRW